MAFLLGFSVCLLGLALQLWPDLAGEGADALRDIFGDQAVAQLETTVFQAQDAINGLSYRLGAARPAAPWAAAADAIAPTAPASTQPPGAAVPAPGAPRPATSSAPTTNADTGWMPAPLPPGGTLLGEGLWSPYLRDPSGRTVAYRTFIQPDPGRPYAVAAIVAFDTQHIRLHLVPGSEEPLSPARIVRTGTIPAADLKSRALLAAFNGGFKARHGHFGMMVDGVTLLPPRTGLGTVAIYADGRISMGAWGTDVITAPNLLAWRQNGPLIIHHGRVNPHTGDITSQDWGIILKGVTAVWRSGLGISADRRTLYYVAGTSLTLPSLVQVLVATGAEEALQLDINTTMVHFDAIESTAGGWRTTPLLNVMKPQRDDRFLTGSTRDYFYVTAAS